MQHSTMVQYILCSPCLILAWFSLHNGRHFPLLYGGTCNLDAIHHSMVQCVFFTLVWSSVLLSTCSTSVSLSTYQLVQLVISIICTTLFCSTMYSGQYARHCMVRYVSGTIRTTPVWSSTDHRRHVPRLAWTDVYYGRFSDKIDVLWYIILYDLFSITVYYTLAWYSLYIRLHALPWRVISTGNGQFCIIDNLGTWHDPVCMCDASVTRAWSSLCPGLSTSLKVNAF